MFLEVCEFPVPARLVGAEYQAFLNALEHDHLIVTAAGNAGCNVDLEESCL